MQKLQLVDQPVEPERVAAEQLTPGQFLAAGELTTGRPTEVLFAHTFPSSGGRDTLIVHRPVGCDWSISTTVGGNRWFDLAAQADLDRFRAGVQRAERIADLRAVANMLEDNPDVPLTTYPLDQSYLHGGGDDAVAKVRELGARFNAKVYDHQNDRTRVQILIGTFEYEVVAWHKDGRPAEPQPDEARVAQADADQLGLAYTRADDEPDDPTPVSGFRVPMHNGGMTEGGLVDETERPECGAWCADGPGGLCVRDLGHDGEHGFES